MAAAAGKKATSSRETMRARRKELTRTLQFDLQYTVTEPDGSSSRLVSPILAPIASPPYHGVPFDPLDSPLTSGSNYKSKDPWKWTLIWQGIENAGNNIIIFPLCPDPRSISEATERLWGKRFEEIRLSFDVFNADNHWWRGFAVDAYDIKEEKAPIPRRLFVPNQNAFYPCLRMGKNLFLRSKLLPNLNPHQSPRCLYLRLRAAPLKPHSLHGVNRSLNPTSRQLNSISVLRCTIPNP